MLRASKFFIIYSLAFFISAIHVYADKGFGVLLTNADEVPIPSFLEHKAFILATNGLIYLKGELNLDGNLCALMADNVAVLSKGFKFETSRTAVKPLATASIVPPPGSNEGGINSAFFIAGRRPLPYLENWSGKTIAIKGSVASIYRRHMKDVVENPSLFTLPSTFTFCHNYKFCTGELYHPLIPVVRSYRIREKRAITEAEYNSGQGTGPSGSLPTPPPPAPTPPPPPPPTPPAPTPTPPPTELYFLDIVFNDGTHIGVVTETGILDSLQAVSKSIQEATDQGDTKQVNKLKQQLQQTVPRLLNLPNLSPDAIKSLKEYLQ